MLPHAPRQNAPATSPENRRQLVVRLCNWIGDVVLSLPALELLEAHGYDLHLYGKGWAPELLAGYAWPVTVRRGKLRERVAQIRAMTPGGGERLALAMPNSFSSALELRLAGLSVSGYARDGRILLLSQRQAPGDEPHALQSFWRLACQLIGEPARPLLNHPPADIGLRFPPQAVQAAEHLMQVHGLKDFICIAPFAAGTVHKQPKKWPAFPDLVKRMVAQGMQVVVCPGPGEEAEAAALYAQAISLPGVPLSVYAALLSRARLVVANDTGPAHIAAAVGTPLISVLGPTRVEQWRPWGSQVQIISHRPNWADVDEVWAAVNCRLAA
jgi:heptosyltransferase-2